MEGASIVLTDQQKGFAFKTTSDSSGRYLFRSIPPGIYTVTADAKGFNKVISGRLKVDINENATSEPQPEGGWSQPDHPGGGARRRPFRRKTRRPVKS